MKAFMERLERLLGLGGIKKDVALLVISGIAVVCSLLNFAAVTLAIIGTLDPVVGALVHNAGSVLVITNSAFLLNWRNK